MKSFVFLLLCTVIILLVFVWQGEKYFGFEGLTEVCFVTEFDYDFENMTKTEKENYIYSTPQNAKFYNLKIDESGIMLRFVERNVYDLIQDFKGEILKIEEIEGKTVFYGFTPFEENFIMLENKKINMQIVEKEGEIIVGLPIILGSF